MRVSATASEMGDYGYLTAGLSSLPKSGRCRRRLWASFRADFAGATATAGFLIKLAGFLKDEASGLGDCTAMAETA